MIPRPVLREACCLAVFLCATTLIGGCAAIPPARGFPEVAALVAARGPEAPALPANDSPAIAELSTTPLTVDTATRIALLRNPQLREHYAALGLAEADLYDAARLANPLFSLEWLDSTAGGARLTLGLAQNFADLLNLSPRRRQADAAVRQTQLDAAAAIVRLASEVEAAYYRHVGAVAVATLRATIARAAATTLELARRYHAAGNLPQQAVLEEQIASTSADLATARAGLVVADTRATLNTLLGLTAAQAQWTLDGSLPLPVAREESLAELHALAGEGRLDLLAARNSLTRAEDIRVSTRRRRLLGGLQLGVQREREPDGTGLIGPTLNAELPLFNWGSGKILRTQAMVEQAQARVASLEIGITNALEAAHTKVATARALVERYRHALLPQREQLVARLRERQQFMLIGPFELLQARQQAFDAYQGYLQALTDYAVARAELTGVIGTRLPSDEEFGRVRLTPGDVSAAQDEAVSTPHDHAHHEVSP